ncbi:MAG: S9 family peptidase [Pseudomonadota bacterium]
MRGPTLPTAFAVLALAAAPALAQQQPTPAAKPEAKSAAPAPKSGLPAPEIFAEKPGFTSLELSPDGRKIAAVENGADKSRLVVFETDASIRKPEYFEVPASSGSSIEWAGPNRLLVTNGMILSLFGVRMMVSNISLVDLKTKKHKDLDPEGKTLFAGNVLYTDPKGDWLLLAVQKSMGGTPWVKRIDLNTGEAAYIEKARPDVWNWFADAAGVVRAGIAYDDDRWTMWYRDRPGVPLVKVKSPEVKGTEGTVDSVHFFPGEGGGAIITNARSDRFAAYRFDFRTGAIGEAIYEHPQVDVTAIVANPATRGIAGVSYEDDRTRIEWVEPAMKAVQQRLDKALPGTNTAVRGRSMDGNRLLIWSGSASNPGTFYLFDQAARRLEALTQPFEKLAAVKLSPVKPIRYSARDGLSIPGYLTLPVSRPERALPLIVLAHGGPFMRDSWNYDPYVQFLASRGYAVLQPNFRGSTGYGKRFVEAGYGQWGRKMQDDVDDGVAWLIQQGMVDPKRVCTMGASYGGYVALWGAIRNPDKYRCAVSLAGVTDLPGMLKHDRKMFAAPRYFRQWESRVRGEKETDLKALSPLAQAARMTVPLLIAHGELDTNVPAEQAHKLVTALASRKGPASEVVPIFYKDEGHGLEETVNIVDFLTRLEAFLAKHNPADPAKP